MSHATIRKRTRRKRPLKERFFRNVNRKGPICLVLGTRCWEWTGDLFNSGYGRIRVIKQEPAHRVAFRNMVAPIPEGMCVLHKCDNPKCVRPDHLFLGTRDVNNKDRASKGRSARGSNHGTYTMPESRPTGKRNGRYTHPETTARGEGNGKSKLTEDKVLRMRYLYRIPGVTQQLLADEFDSSPGNVYAVLSGRTWKHVDVTTRNKPFRKTLT